MTVKKLNQQLKLTQKNLEEINEKLRAQIRLDKVERIRLNDKIDNTKNEILSLNENLFQTTIFGSSALLGTIISLVAGSLSLASVIISGVFGALTVGCGAVAFFKFKKKIRMQKQLLGLEKDLKHLSIKSEEIENLETEVNKLYKERKYIIEKLIEIEKDEIQNKKNLEILEAIKAGEKSAKYVGEDFDASNESLLNYQKSLYKKNGDKKLKDKDEKLKK